MPRLILLVLSVLAVAAVSVAPAGAATVSDCQAQIDQLAVATSDAAFLGKSAAKSEEGLLARLADARVKLDEGKPADAAVKLAQFRDQVVALSSQNKLDAPDAAALAAAADAAIACVATIGV